MSKLRHLFSSDVADECSNEATFDELVDRLVSLPEYLSDFDGGLQPDRGVCIREAQSQRLDLRLTQRFRFRSGTFGRGLKVPSLFQ